MELSNLAIPGEQVAPVELAQPGDNTFEYAGTIRSCAIGKPVFDRNTRELSVDALKKVLIPRPGDKIAGRATNVQGTFAIIEIVMIGNKISRSRFVGLLYIGRASSRRVRSMTDVLRTGDLMSAHVVAVNNGTIHLSTSSTSDGVFEAYCSTCGSTLKYVERNRLLCPICGAREIRKVSPSYGKFEA